MAGQGADELFDGLLNVWQTGPGSAVSAMLTLDYVGHMLHVDEGERDREGYPGWIDAFRSRNPGTRFHIVERLVVGERVFSRIEATRASADGATLISHGMNLSRFLDGLIAEEWAIWTEWRELP